MATTSPKRSPDACLWDDTSWFLSAIFRLRKPIGLPVIILLVAFLSAALATEDFLPEELLSRVKKEYGG